MLSIKAHFVLPSDVSSSFLAALMSCRCHSLPYLQFPHESRLPPPRNVSRPRQLGSVSCATPALLGSAVDVGLVADSTAGGNSSRREAASGPPQLLVGPVLLLPEIP